MDRRRQVPRTDAILADPQLAAAAAHLGRDTVKRHVHAAQEAARRGNIPTDAIVPVVVANLPTVATTLRPVLNATGVILHTNLGRAPLSAAATTALAAAAGYVDVEFDLTTGRRARRGRGTLAALAAACPAAADVLVVNNGAAALALAALALAGPGRDVLISRGELIEIGDGFRLPELLATTGINLVEVGTTNRTTRDDYQRALTERTAFVLKVHTSNYRISGFTAAASIEELVTLGLPVVADLGSGLLRPDPLLPDEPDAQSVLQAGATVVTASGDKLLGGPQAGLVLGASEAIDQMRRHPMARAFRVDKLTLAALEATLLGPATPTHQALHADPETLRARGETLAAAMGGGEVVPNPGAVGGGSAPEHELPGYAVALPERLAEPLRRGDPPVVGRVAHGRLLIDVRCIPPDRDEELARAVKAALTAAAHPR